LRQYDQAPAPGGGSSIAWAAAEVPAAQRQIIHTANLTVRVLDIPTGQQQIADLATGAGGYVASSSRSTSPTGEELATIVIRVPAVEFDGILEELNQVGAKIRIDINAQEVTAEFVDLTSRLTNLQREEAQLTALMARTGNLKDILEVERELARVQGDAEQIEGRLRLMGDQIALSTITVELTKRGRTAIAPASPFDSIYYTIMAFRALETLLRGVVIVVIWAVVFCSFIWVPGVIYLLVRRRRKQRAQSTDIDPHA
jgi:hypothetical protein